MADPSHPACSLSHLLPWSDRVPAISAAAESMLVVLRDGRKIIGMMRSFDQFANIVLESAVERIVVGSRYADVPLGLYVIRGENVVLLGEVVRGPSRHARARTSSTALRGRHPIRAWSEHARHELLLRRMRPWRRARRPNC